MTIETSEQYNSVLYLDRFLLKLNIINDTQAFEVGATLVNDFGEFEPCDYCEEPRCECRCDDEPRYMREYDDGASLED